MIVAFSVKIRRIKFGQNRNENFKITTNCGQTLRVKGRTRLKKYAKRKLKGLLKQARHCQGKM